MGTYQTDYLRRHDRIAQMFSQFFTHLVGVREMPRSSHNQLLILHIYAALPEKFLGMSMQDKIIKPCKTCENIRRNLGKHTNTSENVC